MVIRDAGAAGIVLLAAAIGSFSPASSASTTEIVDPVIVQVSPPITLAQMGKVVRAALAKRGWAVGDARPGYAEGTLVKPGAYTAKIALTYDGQQVSIKYLDSEGLSYDAGDHTIHVNYNKWLRMLSGDIQTFATLMGSDEPSPSPGAAATPGEAPAATVASAPTMSTPSPPAPAAPAAAPAVAPAPAPAPASAKPVSAMPAQLLTAGATVTLHSAVALRGRPSSADAGQMSQPQATVTLQTAMQNAEGRWWYVTAGDRPGWIFERELQAAAR